jgi:hypothetical protein
MIGALAIVAAVAAVQGPINRALGALSIIVVLVALNLILQGLWRVQPLVRSGDVPADDVTHGRSLLYAATVVLLVAAALLLAAGKRWAAVAVVLPGLSATALSYLNPDDALAWWGLILLGPIALAAAVIVTVKA